MKKKKDKFKEFILFLRWVVIAYLFLLLFLEVNELKQSLDDMRFQVVTIQDKNNKLERNLEAQAISLEQTSMQFCSCNTQGKKENKDNAALDIKIVKPQNKGTVEVNNLGYKRRGIPNYK